MLTNVLENFGRQTFLNKKLVIVENGPAVGACKEANISPDILLTSDAHQSCAKNTGLHEVRKRGGGYCTTYDDDDYYGPRYLEELMEHAGEEDVVGKTSFFMRMSNGNLRLYLDHRENSAVDDVVLGPTISYWAEDAVEFKNTGDWGEDGRFVTDMLNRGAGVYTTSRWNFVAQRRSDVQSHSWTATDDQINQCMARGELAFFEGRDYGPVSSYDFVNRLAEEPEYDQMLFRVFNQETDNPAYDLLKHLPPDIQERKDREDREMLEKTLAAMREYCSRESGN
jgi:hypothetical protein